MPPYKVCYNPGMLIIAKQNQSAKSPYHGISGMKKAIRSGADIVHLTVRLTKDDRLVLADTPHANNNKTEPRLRALSLKELRRRTAGGERPITTLEEALERLFGQVMLSIEVHERTAVEPLMKTFEPHLKQASSWDNLILASSNPLILRKLRRKSDHAQLALIHSRHTPLAFIAWHPVLRLSAVMVHRLSVSKLVVEAAHKLDLLLCAYTVNRLKAVKRLTEFGVDAVITDRPESLIDT